jgi:PAS domain S-box-containing protein
VYGWIFLARNEGGSFSEEDEQLVMALAGQVGRIYENGYFYALARSERDRAESYLNTAEVILLALDLTGRITQINRYACTLLGWQAEELLGRDWIDTCVPARMREYRRARLRDLAGGDLSIMENPVVTRTGEERLIEWRNTVMRDGEGNVIGTFSSGTDITERTRAEAQARLQSAALNAAANAIVITDRDGVIEWANPAFSQLTGFSSAEAIGRNPRDLVRSGHHDASFYEQLWDTIQSGQVWRGEMINRRKDGSLYLEEQAITPLRDAQGTIRHFIAVKQDITERKRAEEEIRQRAQLSLLTAGVGLALTQTDSLTDSLQGCADALVTHLGAALARIWTFDEATGGLELQASAGLYARSHGSVPIGRAKIERIARERKPQLTNSLIGDAEVSDQEWARREGMVSFAGHPLIIGDRVVGVMTLFARHPLQESVIAALASVADHIALGIERQRNAVALRTAEERMRFALQSAGVGIWDLDYTTGVLQWSDIAQAQYGLEPGSFPGTFEAFIERVHPEDQSSAQQTIENALKRGGDFTTQHRTIWPDGTVHWLSGAGRVVLGEDGQPLRAIGISLDVTETQRLTEQFQQSQKMEAIGRLAGGVAHDFNNLLTAILGYCELLLSDIGPTDPRRADLKEIHDAGQRAAGLTRQLLAFSRKQIVAPMVVDLNVIVSDLQDMLRRLIGEDVTIRVRLASDLAFVKVDRGQVEQVIMNLAVNARDAMPNGGALTIETANVELDEHYAALHLGARPGRYVALTVTDTGTGMTPEVQARLFEPFFTTKEPGKGTGLGMATVFGIVTQGGGTVGVYSEVGKGTSFKVYFPRSDVHEVVETGAPSAEPSAGTQTVLVVEDEEALRALSERQLKRHGYTVLTAANADEALRIFRENPSIDILLTDVVMPGASGSELTSQMVQERPGLKVIYMSGYTEDAIVHHGVLNPGIAFLNKPFTSDTLARKIQEVINGGAKE